MMVVSAYGRIGQAPRSINTKSGKPMVVASIAVELTGRDGQAATQWLGVVAFGGVADKLAAHDKGEPIGVSGRVQQNTYTKSDGSSVTELQIVVDNIVSARTVRPGGRKRQPSGDAPTENRDDAGPTPSPPAGDGAPFDDDIPF
jgi:single-stranded DNA-binding protein